MLTIILCFCQCLSGHWKQSCVLAARWHGWLKKARLGFLKIKLTLMFCQNKLYPCMLVSNSESCLKTGFCWFSVFTKVILVQPENLLCETICKIWQELAPSSEFFLHRILSTVLFFIRVSWCVRSCLPGETQLFSPQESQWRSLRHSNVPCYLFRESPWAQN